MKHFVLGTAGHVDHGKTTLIKALTGVDTDRLKEEKDRGITIELGFASLKLPSGQTLGIVDVPGHEKFIRHMVSGAAGIDLVMLIIAADEGIMPQTKEHLQICSLLGITAGIVALTKTDMVEKEWLELVKSEIHEFLQGTFLQEAPVIPVSSVKNEGIDDLISALDKTADNIQARQDCAILRLPIDRVFTMKGFGTVVTGTLISDSIKVGEEIQIMPEEIDARVRGIQVHNDAVEEAWAGQRTAINLQGVEKALLHRGSVLARPQTVWPTRRIDVFLEHLSSNAKTLKNRNLVRLHTGTSEFIARVILLGRDELEPGGHGYAQLFLEKSGIVVSGDKFVLRSYSPVTTIGGGQIIDPLPSKHKRLNREVIIETETLKNGALPDKVSVILKRCGFAGIKLPSLVFCLGVSEKRVKEALQEMLRQKAAVLLEREDTTLISSIFYESLKEKIKKYLGDYHKRNPLREGISKEELKASIGNDIATKLFNIVLRELTENKIIAAEKDIVRLFSHRVRLAEDLNLLRQSIAKIYNEAGLTPPALNEVINKFSGKKTEAQNIIKLMLKEGALVKINEDLIFDHSALESLRENYRARLQKDGKATPASFKDMTGLSRKYIIPLMEYFDMTKLTVRVADHRILRQKE